jgi:glucose/arabinose dehydrogenase
MKRLSFALKTSLLAFALACGSPPPGQGSGAVEKSSQANVSFKVEKVIGGLQVPWSIVWAPDGRMIFTERPGYVRVFENGALRKNALLRSQRC